MDGEALTLFSVAIDSLGLMICIGALILARRIGAGSLEPTAVAAPSFSRGVEHEMLRQHIAGAFANIARNLHAEQQTMDTLLDHPGGFAATAQPLPPAGTAQDPNAAICKMAAQGLGVGAIAKALGRAPGEVELRLKLRQPLA